MAVGKDDAAIIFPNLQYWRILNRIAHSNLQFHNSNHVINIKYKIAIYSRSSDHISIKVIPIDSSQQEDSNDGNFIILASILVELCFNKFIIYNFGQNYVNFGRNCRIGP